MPIMPLNVGMIRRDLVFVKDARGCSKRQGIVLYAASMLGNPLPSATMMLATRKLARKRVQCGHLGGRICLLLQLKQWRGAMDYTT